MMARMPPKRHRKLSAKVIFLGSGEEQEQLGMAATGAQRGESLIERQYLGRWLRMGPGLCKAFCSQWCKPKYQHSIWSWAAGSGLCNGFPRHWLHSLHNENKHMRIAASAVW